MEWFDLRRGFGSIRPGGGMDVFVHASAVQSAGMRTLDEGQKVCFDVEPGRRGKPSAVKLQNA